MKLTGNPNNWPDDWKYLYQERAAIKFDSGISTAESEAEQEVREMGNKGENYGGINSSRD